MPDHAVDPVVAYWARILEHAPVTPEVMTQWKRLLDQGIEAWSRALSEMMATEEFAQLLGASIEQWLAAQALDTGDRAQLTALARQLSGLEERLRRLEDRLDRAPGPATGKRTRKHAPATRKTK